MLILIFIYALVGMEMFGGKSRRDDIRGGFDKILPSEMPPTYGAILTIFQVPSPLALSPIPTNLRRRSSVSWQLQAME